MRRIRYSAAMSLDGCIAGPNGELNWMTYDWDDELKKYVEKVYTNARERREIA